jgi:hypothetical protein
LLNVINDLEDALGVFFSFKSSIKTPYYYSYIPTLVLLGLPVIGGGVNRVRPLAWRYVTTSNLPVRLALRFDLNQTASSIPH